jgi:hypothetical protein
MGAFGIKKVEVVYLKHKDLNKRYKDLHINFIETHHFKTNTIEEHKLITKAELIIYINNEGISKVLQSRY